MSFASCHLDPSQQVLRSAKLDLYMVYHQPAAGAAQQSAQYSVEPTSVLFTGKQPDGTESRRHLIRTRDRGARNAATAPAGREQPLTRGRA